jgi:hypothetical protein
MARQTSVQITEATERQVELLKQYGFGSFTDIVRIAIDRMYRDELEALEGKLPDNPVAYIEIEYSEDGMFGGSDGEPRDGYDLRASYDKFEELLTAQLRAEFPQAEISIHNGIGDWHRAKDEDGMELDWESQQVGQTIYDVWGNWEWAIEKKE